MISPSDLTKENGFEDGVVVEINGRPYIFDYFGKYAEGFVESLWCKDGPVFRPEDIKSIKVLTGPMSIWNHAPDNAVIVAIDNDTGDVGWWTEDISEELSTKYYRVSNRPFWAKRSGE